MFTGIVEELGTVLADDSLLTDRTGFARCRPLLRIVMDSQLRLPLDSKMARSAVADVVVVTTSASSPERRKILGGLEALPLAGGIGRRRRADAIRLHGITIHQIPPDEFAVEGYLDVYGDR